LKESSDEDGFGNFGDEKVEEKGEAQISNDGFLSQVADRNQIEATNSRKVDYVDVTDNLDEKKLLYS